MCLNVVFFTVNFSKTVKKKSDKMPSGDRRGRVGGRWQAQIRVTFTRAFLSCSGSSLSSNLGMDRCSVVVGLKFLKTTELSVSGLRVAVR